MRRMSSLLLLSAVAMTGLVLGAVAQPLPKGDKEGGKDGKGPKGPPKFELGRMLPPFIRGELNLTEEQDQKILELERTVKQQLESILTREQLKKLSEMSGKGPKGQKGPPEGGPGNAPKEKGKEKGKGPLEIERAAVKGGIQWFATWESAQREALRSGRPILLVSAAPHCAGVSGVW